MIHRRSAFTLIELLIVMIILVTAIGTAAPRISSALRHTRVNRATTLVTADLQSAFSLASRQRKPVSIAVNSSTLTYTIADKLSGTVLRKRLLGSGSEYRLSSVAFSPAAVDVFPNGVSTAALTITLVAGEYSRQITASTSGLVRRVP